MTAHSESAKPTDDEMLALMDMLVSEAGPVVPNSEAESILNTLIAIRARLASLKPSKTAEELGEKLIVELSTLASAFAKSTIAGAATKARNDALSEAEQVVKDMVYDHGKACKAIRALLTNPAPEPNQYQKILKEAVDKNPFNQSDAGEK